ncbi:MAG: hypothetical protein MN733_09710, partial [Nitrososphaera sp.]|nr:hypothetical protein [Nitrososphaera sp.]
MATPLIRDLSEADIEKAFRDGKLTRRDRDELMDMKARDTLQGLLEEKGFPLAIWERMIDNAQKGWEDLVKSADDEQLWKREIRAVWGEIQILTSFTSALGEVTGQQIETLALGAGASPGLARVLNIAGDVGTGLVPTGIV